MLNQLAVQEEQNGRAVVFSAKIQPRSSREAVVGILGDSLKIALTSPPVDGAANEACIRFVAAALQVGRRDVTIASGHTGRNKRIRVQGLSAAEFLRRVAGLLPSA